MPLLCSPRGRGTKKRDGCEGSSLCGQYRTDVLYLSRGGVRPHPPSPPSPGQEKGGEKNNGFQGRTPLQLRRGLAPCTPYARGTPPWNPRQRAGRALHPQIGGQSLLCALREGGEQKRGMAAKARPSVGSIGRMFVSCQEGSDLIPLAPFSWPGEGGRKNKAFQGRTPPLDPPAGALPPAPPRALGKGDRPLSALPLLRGVVGGPRAALTGSRARGAKGHPGGAPMP